MRVSTRAKVPNAISQLSGVLYPESSSRFSGGQIMAGTTDPESAKAMAV